MALIARCSAGSDCAACSSATSLHCSKHASTMVCPFALTACFLCVLTTASVRKHCVVVCFDVLLFRRSWVAANLSFFAPGSSTPTRYSSQAFSTVGVWILIIIEEIQAYECCFVFRVLFFRQSLVHSWACHPEDKDPGVCL